MNKFLLLLSFVFAGCDEPSNRRLCGQSLSEKKSQVEKHISREGVHYGVVLIEGKKYLAFPYQGDDNSAFWKIVSPLSE